MRCVIEACGFQRITDLIPSAVEQFLAELRARGQSTQTVNHYVQSAKQFSSWLVRDRRTGEDRLTSLARLNVEIDRRHDRRALSANEFARLVEAAETGPPLEGLPGPDRATLYLLARWTGFRRKELASLTRRSIILDGPYPVVRVVAAHTKAKNRRVDEAPLHPAVVERLRSWLSYRDIDNGKPLFQLQTAGGWWRKASKMVKADSERAGLPYVNEDGLYADFHAHRHGLASDLARAGVPPAVAQKILRHSTYDLTSRVYTHLEVADKAAAFASLPAPSNNRLPHGCHESGISGHNETRETRPSGQLYSPEEAAENVPQVVAMKGFGTSTHGQTEVETSGLEPPTPGLQSRCSPS